LNPGLLQLRADVSRLSQDNGAEYLPAVLFQEDGMGTLTDFHPAAVGRRRQFAEHDARHLDRTVAVPFAVDKTGTVMRSGSYSGLPAAQNSRLSISVPFGAINCPGPGPARPHAKIALLLVQGGARSSTSEMVRRGMPTRLYQVVEQSLSK
jgi:hypothetical protein